MTLRCLLIPLSRVECWIHQPVGWISRKDLWVLSLFHYLHACIFLPFVLPFQLCRCIATWKQPAADGRSSSAEKTAVWTSRERGRITRRWDEAKPVHVHISSSLSTQINTMVVLFKHKTLSQHTDRNGDEALKYPLRNCTVSKTSCFRATPRVMTDSLYWTAKRQDPPIQMSFLPSVFVVLAILSRVSETFPGAQPRLQWHAVILPPFQQEIST